MIPYVTLPPFEIGGFILRPFAILVSLGVLTAHFLLLHRAQRLGLARARAAELSLAMVVCGFAGAIAFKLLYRPEMLAAIWTAGVLPSLPGISSFGGLFGALAGAWAYLALRRIPGRLSYLDAAAFAFPFGFAWGRAGCAITHDHPGLRSDAWLAVAYPGGARYDLGLLELLFLIAVAIAFVILARRPRPAGFFFAAMLLIYGPFRIALDRLHVDPPRYAGFSVDQWSGAAVACLGLFFWRRIRMAGPL